METQEKKDKNFIRGGLLPLIPDSRDFRLGAITKLPSLSELPENFSHNALEIKNQFDSDFCVAFSSTAASELQEGILLSPEYQFALIKEIAGGDPDSFGADLRDAMKSFTKVGSIEKKDCPFSLTNKDQSFLRRIENYPPELKSKALIHAKKVYVSVDGQYDAFDNIRASLWLYRNEKRVPIFGVRWGWDLANPVIQNITTGGSGHALYVCGWKKIGNETYLIVPNSYGTAYGDKGYFYFPRKVINEFIPIFGAFMFVDLTKEEYLRRAEEMKLGFWEKLLKAIKELLYLDLLWAEKLKPEPEPQPEPQPKPQPEPEPVRVSKLIPFCEAIKTYEGWFENSRSYRNRNPGNLKFTSLTASLGATNRDFDNFCIFPTYEKGWEVLKSFVKLASNNQLRDYHDCDILSFFKSYAPSSDNNFPIRYASWVANQINESPEAKLFDFI